MDSILNTTQAIFSKGEEMKRACAFLGILLLLSIGYLYWLYLSHYVLIEYIQGHSSAKVLLIQIEGQQKSFIIDDPDSLAALAKGLRSSREGFQAGPSYNAWIHFDYGRISRCSMFPHPTKNCFIIGYEIWASERDMYFRLVEFEDPIPKQILIVLEEMRMTQGE